MSRQEWKKSLQHHPEWKSVSGVGMLVGKSFESFKLQKKQTKKTNNIILLSQNDQGCRQPVILPQALWIQAANQIMMKNWVW